MHKTLDPRDDVDRLYVARKAGGKGHVSIEDNVDALKQSLQDYMKKRRRKLIPSNKNNTDSTSINGRKIPSNKNGEKNKTMDISKEKQKNSHTRQLLHG